MTDKSDQEVKLNLGCYDKQIKGFLNIDSRSEVNPDVVDDAFELKSFDNESVDLIYSSHCLEHCERDKLLSTLMRWYSVLKKGGVLRVAVPDFEALCKRYVYTGDIQEVRNSVLGSAKHQYDYHFHLFDEKFLTHCLKQAGFSKVARYNWWDTDHAFVDDFSQAYLPARGRDIALSHGRVDHGDGILVSLNVEAVK